MSKISRFGLYLLALALCIPLFFVPVCAAGTNRYDLDELYMQIDIPASLLVYKQDIPADDPVLAELGVDPAEMEAFYRDHHIYLNAVDPNAVYEIRVTMYDDDDSQKIFNYSLYDDAAMNSFMDDKSEEFAAYGRQVQSCTVQWGNPATYLVIDSTASDENEIIYIRQYATIYNGLAINIELYSYNRSLTNELQNLLQNIVSSISFTQTLTPKPTPTPTLTIEDYAAEQAAKHAHKLSRVVAKALVAVIVALVSGGGVLLSRKKKKSRAAQRQVESVQAVVGAPSLSNLPAQEVPEDAAAANRIEDAGQRYCGSCGAKIRSGGYFCEVCGARLK